MAVILDDLPPEELRFHFKGGRLSLDFVTTVGERWRRSFERLRTPDDLRRWIGEAGLVPAPRRVTAAQLEDGRALREAINRLARPGARPHRGDHALVNRWAARPDIAPQLSADGELTHTRGTVEAMYATIARDAIDLLTGPLAGRIRECGAPDCALLFVDASRPGRRRWCSTTACGNRARTKAYRSRRKERTA
ncbi:MAG: CGNR zinc finger domain-containing protein [Solirubrobacteraceae bacterium]